MNVFRCVVVVLLAGCGGLAVAPGYMGPAYIPTSRVSERLQQRGLSVSPPRGGAWMVDLNEQTPLEAVFRQELPSTTHSFLALAVLVHLEPGVPFEQAAALQGFDDPARYEVLEYKVQPDTSRKTPCTRYTLRLLVKTSPNAPNTPLQMLERGTVCAHPTMRDMAVRASFSERGIPTEMDPALWSGFDDFLGGIQIESAPGVPVAQLTVPADRPLDRPVARG